MHPNKDLPVWALALVVTAFGCTGRKATRFDGTDGSKKPTQQQQPQQQPGEQQQGGTDGDVVTAPPNTTNPDGTVVDPYQPNQTATPPAGPVPPPTASTPQQPPPPGPPASPPQQPGKNPEGFYEVNGANVTLQDLAFAVPSGWTLHQDAQTDGTTFLGFAKGSDYVRIYVKKAGGFQMASVFTGGGQERSEKVGARDWKRLDTQKGQLAVAAFALDYQEHTYYGFARAASAAAAADAAKAFLGAVK